MVVVGVVVVVIVVGSAVYTPKPATFLHSPVHNSSGVVVGGRHETKATSRFSALRLQPRR